MAENKWFSLGLQLYHFILDLFMFPTYDWYWHVHGTSRKIMGVGFFF